jgi:ethanolamine utilization microcompartment shell protein EutL
VSAVLEALSDHLGRGLKLDNSYRVVGEVTARSGSTLFRRGEITNAATSDVVVLGSGVCRIVNLSR